MTPAISEALDRASGRRTYCKLASARVASQAPCAWHRWADGFDLPVSVMNCPGNFMSEFAAVLPNHIWMEVVDPGYDYVFKHDSRVEDGYYHLG